MNFLFYTLLSANPVFKFVLYALKTLFIKFLVDKRLYVVYIQQHIIYSDILLILVIDSGVLMVAEGMLRVMLYRVFLFDLQVIDQVAKLLLPQLRDLETVLVKFLYTLQLDYPILILNALNLNIALDLENPVFILLGIQN